MGSGAVAHIRAGVLGKSWAVVAGREVPLCYLLPAHCLPKGRAVSPAEPGEEQRGENGEDEDTGALRCEGLMQHPRAH